MTAVWYVQRAVPWATLGGTVLVAVVLVGSAHLWDRAAAVALPLTVLVTAAGGAWAYDEPAIAVSTVTPRALWCARTRFVAGTVPPAAGFGAILLAPGSVDSAAWGLVTATIASVALLLAASAARRQVPSPGAAVAGLVALLGLALLVIGPFVDLPATFPAPGLSRDVVSVWCGVLALSIAGTLRVLVTPTPRPRSVLLP
jgi:uncharacterized membrane protein (UPF0136 family)